MKAEKHKKSNASRKGRLSFPSDEKNHPWLPILLDAYAVVDKGVDEAIKTAFKEGRILACGKGCSNCCRTHQTIPVYPLELVGLSWYVTEKLTEPERSVIKTQLYSYKEKRLFKK